MNGLRYPVTIERLPPMTVFEARGPEAELADAVAAAGLPWPAAFNDYALGADEADLVRLGPTRLLILVSSAAAPAIAARVAAAFDRQPTADAVDVSDMLTGFVVSGSGAEDVLRQGAPLDLDATRFPAGRMTGTELWGVTVILGRMPLPAGGFRILVDIAYAAFVEEWLAVASGAPSVHRPGTMVRPPARIRPTP
ncbi:hypothetical protein ABB55_06945 [Prosthecomicrobium hirschii]|uniref:Sarcosine oxidase subunit gamma n=1 Tax=Prosthecodimorpha hirschii TaxID=665126 RepID=A0A0P6VNS0_9HYPH|nr:sarcosine oxidase subunit gamma family protein [Prosthecomicrobium hirschii]KPL51995.1 hypothetical protein ABB55_06945 [Prosthecomicrobium hirschii]